MGKTYVIDVREPHEYQDAQVEGALNIPVGQIEQLPKHIDGITSNDTLVLYCRSGGRAGMACQILGGLGYKRVVNGINQQNVEDQLSA
jgi:phage shock protein E